VRYLPGAEDLAGSALIVYCLMALSSVRAIIALTVEPNRSWLLARLRIHRLLMGGFAAAGVVEAFFTLVEPVGPNTYLIATINLLGSIFIWFGVSMKLRMSSAMQQTIAELVPICAWCKQVRVEEAGRGEAAPWISMEAFLADKTHARVTHGICPACAAKVRADMATEKV